jgi:uncharacterized protein (DUF305 family)
MKKRKSSTVPKVPLLYAVVGFVLGAALVGGVASYGMNNHNEGVMRALGVHEQVQPEKGVSGMSGMADKSGMSMTMSDMTAMLQNKTGDEFDKAFLDEMVPHHQGAVDMANLAKQYAKHDEIKTMANDILTTQSKEIDTMKGWQEDWGYQSSYSREMME